MRQIVRVGVWIAAAGSLACTLYTGRHNSSVLLIVLFAVWVFSPFVGLAWVNRIAESGPRDLAAAIRASSLVICVSSLILYAAVGASRATHHTAAAFLLVPASSWLAVLTMWLAPRLMRKR